MRLCGVYLQRGRLIAISIYGPIVIILLFSRKFLNLFNQDGEVSEMAYLYIISYMPGLLLLGLNDLQRKFLIQCKNSKAQMNSQFAGTILHVLFNYIFVVFLQFGIVGTGAANFCTNFFLLVANVYQTKIQDDLKDSLTVKLTDPQVLIQWREYFRIGLPNIAILVLDWACFEFTTLIAL